MALPTVAIVGAPNAGKSTLFNRLLGRRRALVHREPGMTRDINEAECLWEADRRVILADTGGLFPQGDGLARQVRQRVEQAARSSDVLIFVVDGRTGPSPLDGELARLFRATGRPIVLAVNKLDTAEHEIASHEFHSLGFDSIIPISAEHGLGIGELRAAVEAILPADAAPEARPENEIRVALCGRPNVGKSSLLNRLLGEDRSLVNETPGTTRDSVDSVLRRDTRLWRFVDTAGLRRRGHVDAGMEGLAAMAARRSIEAADVAVLLMDCTEAPTLQDLHVAGVAIKSGRPFLVALNKWDLIAEGKSQGDVLIEKVRSRLRFAPWAPIVTLSARTGERVERLFGLLTAIRDQSGLRITTGRLNNWLQRSVAAHRPPARRGGKEMKFSYAAQQGIHPPSFVIFTNSGDPPHFSYKRYLDNSLRSRFGLDLTPVVVIYREKPRRAGRSSTPRRRPRKQPV